jgi:Domain of unknown function (DUF4956)
MTDTFFNLNVGDFWGVMMRFGITIIYLFILLRVIYFRYSKNEMSLFIFFSMGIMIFFLGTMMHVVYFEIGMAFGLFAIFHILRFRTRTFPVKDMAYMFTTIGLSLINSLKLLKFPLLGLLIFNTLIILSAYLLEISLFKFKVESYYLIYDNLELLKTDKKQKILNDLSIISGKNIFKFKILSMNCRSKVARLEIFYKV